MHLNTDENIGEIAEIHIEVNSLKILIILEPYFYRLDYSIVSCFTLRRILLLENRKGGDSL